MITKKHFNKIAELVRTELQPKAPEETTFAFIKRMADFFESDNPNFHRGKFIHACYNEKK
jgi:hypothetical protein|tara:strand:- start:128 stop:307 length:180 start_codon:yes stop_codon:yes gene_type:complete